MKRFVQALFFDWDYYKMETKRDFSSCGFYSISIIILVYIIRLISNACYETPAGLQYTITRVMNIDTKGYTLIFSVSQWPSVTIIVIFSVLAGYTVIPTKLCNYLSVRVALVSFVLLSLLGQSVSVLGIFYSQYSVVLLGRFIVGTGNFVSLLSTFEIFRYWFRSDYMMYMLVLSMDKIFSRLGKGLGLIVPQYIYDGFNNLLTGNTTYSLGTTISVKIGAISFTLLLSFIIFILDIVGAYKTDRDFCFHFRGSVRLMVIECKPVSLRSWIIFGLYATYLPVIYALSVIGQVMFIQKYDVSVYYANVANSLIYFSLVLFLPFISKFINLVGFHVHWVQFGIVSSIAVQALMISTSYHQWYIPFIVTVAYSLCFLIVNVSLSTLIGRIQKESHTVTSLDLTYNTSLAVILVIEGLIIDSYGYFALGLFYIFLLYSSLMLSICLWLVELAVPSQRPRLNMSGKKWRELLAEHKEVFKKSSMLPECEPSLTVERTAKEKETISDQSKEETQPEVDERNINLEIVEERQNEETIN